MILSAIHTVMLITGPPRGAEGYQVGQDDQDVGLTTAKHNEVLVLDRDQREGELHLQEQVQAWRYNY